MTPRGVSYPTRRQSWKSRGPDSIWRHAFICTRERNDFDKGDEEEHEGKDDEGMRQTKKKKRERETTVKKQKAEQSAKTTRLFRGVYR